MLGPIQLVENIQEGKQLHKPNQPNIGPNDLAREYMRPGQKESLDVIKEMCVYTAIELSSQPDIRRGLKKHIYDHGWIITQPTDKGNKELDVFHPCYRVKRVSKRLSELSEEKNGDLFLDILQNQALGLITFQIAIKDECEDDRIGNKYFEKMLEMFKISDDNSKWKFVRREIFEIFTAQSQDNSRNSKSFLVGIMDEVKNELKEDSEKFVLE